MRFEIVLLLGLSFATGACDRQSAPKPQPAGANVAAAPSSPAEPKGVLDRSHKGLAWPPYRFEAPNGDKVTLADFKGRAVLMNLWATYCAPCIKELGSIERLAQREAEKLQVLAISQDDIGRAKVEEWWQRQNFSVLQPYIEAKADFSFHLASGGGGALPITVLYDKSGRELWRVVGPMDWAGPEAAKLIAEAG